MHTSMMVTGGLHAAHLPHSAHPRTCCRLSTNCMTCQRSQGSEALVIRRSGRGLRSACRCPHRRSLTGSCCASESNAASEGQSPADEGHKKKKCQRCGEAYELRLFPKQNTQPDGRWIHCCACHYEQKLIAKPYRRLDDHENPPTMKPLECAHCKSRLRASFFAMHPLSASGRQNICHACAADKTRRNRDKPRSKPQQKTCRECGVQKDAAEFYANRAYSDGLVHRCKACQKAVYGGGQKPAYKVEVLEKVCLRCKVVKPAAEFCRYASRFDGLYYYCRQCEAEVRRR